MPRSRGRVDENDWGYVDIMRMKPRGAPGVTVERQAAQVSAETLAQLRAGRADYDLVPLGDYAVTPAMEEGHLQPLDLDQVPAHDDVFDFLNADYFEQDGEVYGIPRSFGQTPLAVNTDIVEQDVTALADLWTEPLAGVVGGRDDARLQVLYRNAAKGEPLNPTRADDVDFDSLRTDLIDRLERLPGSGTTEASQNNCSAVSAKSMSESFIDYAYGFLLRRLGRPRMRPTRRFYPPCIRDGAENRSLEHVY